MPPWLELSATTIVISRHGHFDNPRTTTFLRSRLDTPKVSSISVGRHARCALNISLLQSRTWDVLRHFQ